MRKTTAPTTIIIEYENTKPSKFNLLGVLQKFLLRI